MNTRLGETLGTWHANALVQSGAAALSWAALIWAREGSFSHLGETNKWYFLAAALGLAITVTVMLGMGALGPTTAVSIILISQLLTAAAIEALGLMGSEKLPLAWPQLGGLALMIAGVLLFKKT